MAVFRGFWQKCADEARNVAKSLTHPTDKREMLLVAEYFAMLAKQAQRKQSAKGTAVKSFSLPLPEERLKGARRMTCASVSIWQQSALARFGIHRGIGRPPLPLDPRLMLSITCSC